MLNITSTSLRAIARRLLPGRVRNLVSGLRAERILLDTITPFNHLQVVEKAGIRYLVFVDDSPTPVSNRPEEIYQSCIFLRDPLRTTAPYIDFFHLPFVFHVDIRSVLMIGLGGGTAARQFLNDYPQVTIDAVEIDPVVIDVARQFFGLPDDSRLTTHTDDGRSFIQKTGPKYDLVVLDAFFSRTIPYHLCTREFLKEICGRLADRGLVIININSALRGRRSWLLCRMYTTFRSEFSKVYCFASAAHTPERYQNIVLIALRTDVRYSSSELQIRARELAKQGFIRTGLVNRTACLYPGPVCDPDLAPLIDEHCPPGGLLDIYHPSEFSG